MKVDSLKRMGSVRTTPDLATVTTVVRRLGYVAVKVHETVMANLLAEGKEEVAEAFNDVFKPLADAMLNFDIEVAKGQVDGGL